MCWLCVPRVMGLVCVKLERPRSRAIIIMSTRLCFYPGYILMQQFYGSFAQVKLD